MSLITITPTSIASTGTSNSSSIGSNGKVTFSSCATISLNGVFSSTYDNYLISILGNSSDDGGNVMVRMRSAGTDASNANYNFQQMGASGTSVTGARSTLQTSARLITLDDSAKGAGRAVMYGPFLSQATCWRGLSTCGGSGIFYRDFGGSHSLATSYDGITLLSETGGQSISGSVTIYGFAK